MRQFLQATETPRISITLILLGLLCGCSSGKPPALMVALHVWSMSHGIASLFLGAGNAARRLLPMEPEDLLEAGVLIYLGALGVPGAR